MNTKILCSAFAIFALGAGITANAASFNPLSIDLNRAAGVAKNLGTAASPLPEKDEIALGRELAGRTMGAAPLIDDPRLQGYVNRVGRSVAAQSERPDLPWRFGVLDSPSINAFASPGGIILITRGLYELLDNEAQLAGVIGHEVAHVDKHHHSNVVRKQAGTSALAGVGQEIVSQRARGMAAPVLNQLLGTGAELFTKKLDRSAELEADEVGAVLAVRAGYSAAGLIDVLHKLNAHAGEPSTNLLYATHPHPTERLTALGDSLGPKMASLPEGNEPALQVTAASLPAPTTASASRAAPAAGARALSSEQQQAQQEPPGGSTANNLLGGQRGGGGSNPVEGLFRGILGR